MARVFSVRHLTPNWNALQLPEGWYVGEFDLADSCDPDTLTGPFRSRAEAEIEMDNQQQIEAELIETFSPDNRGKVSIGWTGKDGTPR